MLDLQPDAEFEFRRPAATVTAERESFKPTGRSIDNSVELIGTYLELLYLSLTEHGEDVRRIAMRSLSAATLCLHDRRHFPCLVLFFCAKERHKTPEINQHSEVMTIKSAQPSYNFQLTVSLLHPCRQIIFTAQ